MIAIVDTCAILNLIQINYDDKYIRLLEKVFDEVKIVPLVFKEICENKFENVFDSENKELLDEIIFKQVQNFIEHDTIEKVLNFTKKSNAIKFKENGESHSVGYAMTKSRLGNSQLMENLLKTHFISDDSPAKSDFEYFYQINVAGQILDSIDLMTIFCLKELIGKNEVIQYCTLLKQLYNKDVSVFLINLKKYHSSYSGKLSAKEKTIVTKIIDIISSMNDDFIDEILKIKTDPSFRSIIKKGSELDNLLTKILSSNSREKIPNINKRIADLSKVWELDYN